VTPSSKVVGDLALAMVTQDLSPADVVDPRREIAFPDSVVQMMRGELGQPPGGWPKDFQAKVLKGSEPILVRPGSLLEAADLDGERDAAKAKIGWEPDDRALASYLMYPKVFCDFAAAQERYGPTEVLPTPVYFYGLGVGQEISVELERGKVLVIRCQAIGEPDENGEVRVFFELNGQPRIVRVPDRAHAASSAKRRPKAEPGRADQVAAPMPGVVSGLAVSPGQTVRAGDVLLSIEAMKMETALHADRDGTIAEILVRAGEQIDAKDLLIRFQA
jgi:pyruvate carboxylase